MSNNRALLEQFASTLSANATEDTVQRGGRDGTDQLYLLRRRLGAFFTQTNVTLGPGSMCMRVGSATMW
jgi:hypothetical protein